MHVSIEHNNLTEKYILFVNVVAVQSTSLQLEKWFFFVKSEANSRERFFLKNDNCHLDNYGKFFVIITWVQ